MTIEVLAPVGNMDMFYAAVAAGANAVFLAAKDFGARAYANNFDLEEIKEIVDICATRDINVHVTVNTLIKEDEMDQALALISKLNEIGVDAIIVQDLGLLSIGASSFPSLEFHCSTQLSANNSLAANYLASLGADRIILARELSYEQIENIKENTDIDLEVFAHGSICVSYSGKCTMSSFIGGRSGNRGRCAQPCRKEYELLKPSFESLGKAFYLSPKDLAVKLGAKRLQDLGIKSIKIEGRMKKPEYVYTAVKYYKALVEGEKIDLDMVAEVSNRGFTKGIIGGDRARDFSDYTGESDRGKKVGYIKEDRKKYIAVEEQINGQDSLEIDLENKKYTITISKDYYPGDRINLNKFPDAIVGSEVYRISNARLRDIDYKKEIENEKIPVQADLSVFVGNKPRLKFSTKYGQVISQLDEVIEEGKNVVLDYDYAFNQLSKLNDTDFYLENLKLSTDGSSFMSASMLNELRRKAVGEILKMIKENESPSFKKTDLSFYEVQQKDLKTICIDKWDEELMGYDWDEIVLRDLDAMEKIEGKRIIFELPMIINDEDYEPLRDYISSHEDLIDGLMVSNSWDVSFARDFTGMEIIVSEYANNFNTYSLNVLKEAGADRVILSAELSIDEIRQIKKILGLGVAVYSRPIEMIMNHCLASVLGCDFNCNTCRYSKGHYLRNSSGDTYIFTRYKEKITEIKNIKAIIGLDFIEDFKSQGIKNFIYRLDNREDYNILNKKANDLREDDYRQGHFKEGVL